MIIPILFQKIRKIITTCICDFCSCIICHTTAYNFNMIWSNLIYIILCNVLFEVLIIHLCDNPTFDRTSPNELKIIVAACATALVKFALWITESFSFRYTMFVCLIPCEFFVIIVSWTTSIYILNTCICSWARWTIPWATYYLS